MTIRKHTKIPLDEYHRLHRRLRDRLLKEAFDNYYHCQRCGAHKDLQIHIPNCDPHLQDQPGFYMILCPLCHKLLSTK